MDPNAMGLLRGAPPQAMGGSPGGQPPGSLLAPGLMTGSQLLSAAAQKLMQLGQPQGLLGGPGAPPQPGMPPRPMMQPGMVGGQPGMPPGPPGMPPGAPGMPTGGPPGMGMPQGIHPGLPPGAMPPGMPPGGPPQPGQGQPGMGQPGQPQGQMNPYLMALLRAHMAQQQGGGGMGM